MKKLIVLIVAIIGFTVNNATAQSKFGYVNTSEILVLMPELKRVQTVLDSFQVTLTDEYNIMLKEYEKLLADRDKLVKEGASQSMIDYKDDEIMQKQQLIQKFQGLIEQQLIEKQNLLMKPLIDKVQTAINDVAKEKQLNYVFDLSQQVILYKDPADDITKDIRKKMGIPENATVPK